MQQAYGDNKLKIGKAKNIKQPDSFQGLLAMFLSQCKTEVDITVNGIYFLYRQL